MRLVDTHAHLTMLSSPPRAVLERARDVGVSDIVCVGDSTESSAAAIDLAELHDGSDGLPAVWATVGVHPHHASRYDGQADRRIREMAAHPRVVAVGETGMDLHYEHSPRDEQLQAFMAQARIACDTGLPLVVHAREAEDEVHGVLAGFLTGEGGDGPRLGAAVVHCFTGDEEWARRFVEIGCHIGVGGIVTFKKADALRRAVAEVPDERLLLETDCPYLSPEPYRDRENEPSHLPLIAEALGRAEGPRDAEAARIAAITSRNARRVFGFTGPDTPLTRPSYVRDLLARHGHRLGKSLGQHLLVDRSVLSRILDAAGIRPDDVALEVGPGIGTLTRELSREATRVVAVEADRRLQPILSETLRDSRDVTLLFEDALGVDVEAFGTPEPTVLVANLPYNVAATLVLSLMDRVPSIERGTVMVQREVAERMCASPGNKAYGAYTVKLALRAKAELLFRVGAGAFFPPPRVESAVVRLTREEPRPAAPPVGLVDIVADAAFSQRRKMLRSSLAAGLGSDRSAVEKALSAAGIDPTARAENLTPGEFVRLTEECSRAALVTLRS